MNYYDHPPKFVTELAFDVVKQAGMPGHIARDFEVSIAKALIQAYIAGRNDSLEAEPCSRSNWDKGS